MLLYARLAPSKPPKRRSRAGCASCKEKKKKCDEERPCARCSERGLDCTYEPVKPRQRRKRVPTTSASDANHVPRPRLSVHVPSGDSRYDDEVHNEKDPDWGYESPGHFSLDGIGDLTTASPSEGPLALFSPGHRSPTTTCSTGILPALQAARCSFNFMPGVPEYYEQRDEMIQRTRRYSSTSTVLSLATPFISDMAMIASRPMGSPLLDFFPPSFSEFSDRSNRRALVNHFCGVLSHLIVLREESGNPFQQLVLPLTRNSSAVLNAIYALASAHLEYRGVEQQETSMHFHSQAIQSIAALIQEGGKGNKNEILAAIMLLVYYEVLVQRGRSNIVEGHLKGALTVMRTNSEPLDATGIFLERAFRFYDVIAALSNGTGPLSAAPAAGCLMPFPPPGAPATSPLSNVDTLLGLAHTLWPIIHRLSSLLALKRELEVAVQNNAMSSKIVVLRTEFESTAEAVESALGKWFPHLPPDFFPDEADAITLSGVIADATENIKLTVDAAEGPPPAQNGRIRSILHNALAYRHSAFVYLYRTIHARPRSHELVQKHAHLALVHCVATVSHAGPMGALLWPLFVAACEAVSRPDRELAGRAFLAIKVRQGMMNIERAWEIVKEVWRRADLAERLEREQSVLVEVLGDDAAAELDTKVLEVPQSFARRCYQSDLGTDLWRRVKEEMGVHVVFG